MVFPGVNLSKCDLSVCSGIYPTQLNYFRGWAEVQFFVSEVIIYTHFLPSARFMIRNSFEISCVLLIP